MFDMESDKIGSPEYEMENEIDRLTREVFDLKNEVKELNAILSLYRSVSKEEE